MNWTVAERRLQSRHRGAPRNMGRVVNAGPVPLSTPQCCTHHLGVKYVQANACPFWAANRPCTSGYPLDNCRNQVPTQGPTAPRLTTNVSETIEEDQESGPTLCQAIKPVIFHQDAPAFSPRILPRGDDWPSLLARANTAHTAPALTKTAAPNPDTPVAVGSGKRNSNCARLMDGQTVSPIPPANQDSDGTLVEIIV